MKKVPEKLKGCGIRVQCLKCRAEVTDTCKLKGKSISVCANKEKHKFKLVVHKPNTQSGKLTRLVESETFDQALIELAKFKEEIKEGSAQTVPVEEVVVSKVTKPTENVAVLVSEPKQNEQAVTIQNNFQILQVTTPAQSVQQIEAKPKWLLVELASKYLDTLAGVNTPIHLIRKRSDDHISENRRVIERFCKALKEAGHDIDTLDITKIGQVEIGIFCEYLLNVAKLSSYNKYCVIMKAFYNWCIDVQDVECKNPFNKIQLSFNPKSEKTAINKDEFSKLLQVMNRETGTVVLPGGKKTNLYHTWLPIAFRLALETGLRTEEVVTLKFSNIMELQEGVLVIKLINLKVWRIKTGQDQKQMEKYVKYVPVTASLLKLLNDAGFEDYKGEDRLIIPIPEEIKLSYAKDIVSRAFTHFIKQVTPRKIEYKDLRKTYITHLTMALGNKTKLFTGHSDDAVIQNHYLADAVLMGGLTKLDIFGT